MLYRRVLSIGLVILGISNIFAADMQSNLKGYQDFSFACFSNLYEATSDANQLFSPLSLATALGMAEQGALGCTQREMRDLLKGVSFKALQNYVQEMLIRNQQYCDVTLANALYLNKDYSFVTTFQKTVEQLYQASVVSLDFSLVKQAVEVINQWCVEQTHGLIESIVEEDNLGSDTVAVLLNALYFKGNWLHQFEKEATRQECFTTSNGQELSVPMMHQVEKYRYAESDFFRMVEMPYDQTDLAMVLVLAKDSSVSYQKFNVTDLAYFTETSFKQLVHVGMPKFTSESFYSCNKMLQRMGMQAAFLPCADFSGMIIKNNCWENFYISKILQKTYIKVDEQGSEAAAVTAIIACKSAVPAESIEFILDRPFMYFIRDTKTGMILFIGTMNNPMH